MNEYWWKAEKCIIWLTSTKPFFREKEANLETFQKIFLHIGVSYKFVSNSSKSINRIFWTIEYWYKAWKYQFFLINTKPFFWGNEANLETFRRTSTHLGVSYKLVLKSAKSINGIFGAMEYLFKALQCQIYSTNTRPFFWQSEANFDTLQKCSSYIGVSYKFVLKSVKCLNWSCEQWNIGLKLYNTKFGRRIQNHFSGKARQTLKLSKNFLPIFEFPINLF